jgi:hypothetical protein
VADRRCVCVEKRSRLPLLAAIAARPEQQRRVGCALREARQFASTFGAAPHAAERGGTRCAALFAEAAVRVASGVTIELGEGTRELSVGEGALSAAEQRELAAEGCR